MKANHTEKLVYYRPNTYEVELISKSDLKRIRKIWGNNRPYNFFEEMEEDHNFGTGLHIVTELMFTMQCNKNLNERKQILEERIKKGLTPSKSRGSKYVECNLLNQLIEDARAQFIKDGGDLREAFGLGELEDKRRIVPPLPYREFMRLFGIPYHSVMDEVKKCEEQVSDVTKPEHTRHIKYECGYTSQCGAYKTYIVKGKLHIHYNDDIKGKLYKKFNYLGKLHQSMFGENNIQINLYDCANRNWGLQNVVDYLVKNKYITLC